MKENITLNSMFPGTILLITLLLVGCGQPAEESVSQVLTPETQQEALSASKNKRASNIKKDKVITVTGTIIPGSRDMNFIGVPATVSLNEMDKDHVVRAIASMDTKAAYETGFLANFTLNYSSKMINEGAIYYIKVEGKEGDTILWENNIMASGLKDLYSDTNMNITVHSH